MAVERLQELLAEHKGTNAPRTTVVDGVTFHRINRGSALGSRWVAEVDGRIITVRTAWGLSRRIGDSEPETFRANVEGFGASRHGELGIRFRVQERAMQRAIAEARKLNKVRETV